ncbi:MAG: hypothetical protein LC122_04725 [Chitinophagales bacterium]|nr:hypothetical protein [Chitinophagales bacterium]
MAIVKKTNLFGLIDMQENLLLSPHYDLINYCGNGIYLVVQHDLYGFYNAVEKCFVTAISYNYDQSKPTTYYTTGTHFKLIQGEKKAIVDANGKQNIPFGTYQDVFFAKCDVIRYKETQSLKLCR